MNKEKVKNDISEIEFIGEEKCDGYYKLTYSIPVELIDYLIKIYGENYEEGMNKDFNNYLNTIVELHKIGGDELVKRYMKIEEEGE